MFYGMVCINKNYFYSTFSLLPVVFLYKFEYEYTFELENYIHTIIELFDKFIIY